MLKLPFKLPRLSLRLRLSISITAIVALFTLTNITYQISSQNRNLRLDNLQKAVQGQLASVTTRQLLQNQQKEILVLDALKQSGEETLSDEEIDNGIKSLESIALEINRLGTYAYRDSLQVFQQLVTNHAELDMLWQQFYTGYNSDQTPLASSIELVYNTSTTLLSNFVSIEIQSAEQLTDRLQKVSRFNDQITLGIYLFTIALTVGLGYLLIRYTTKSLNNLNVGTIRIGRGDLDYHIPVTSYDEIGDLTIAFNEMSDKLRNAMAQVQQSKENADEANRAKTNFLANMSHELRTPLNAIIGYSEMTIEVYGEDNQLDEQQVINDLQHILSSGRHLLQLINDVLDLAKIESGNMTVFNETFDSVKIIENLATTMLPLAKKNNNKLVVESSNTIPMLHSDAVKFRQIFINLVSNACKFTHDGKITIRATFNAETDELIYHVSDTGIGMSPEAMQNIFEAFVQADSDTARKYGGTGLGLSICKQFVEMMHGSLDLTSAPGAGTTFTVVLPINIRSQRKTDVIPTKNQQELGLIAPDAQSAAIAASTSEAADGSALPASQSSAVHMAPSVDVLLLSEQHESEALSKNLDESNYKLFHILNATEFVAANAQRTYDFLFGYLNRNNQQAFNTDWKNLRNMLENIEEFGLPALLLCCDVLNQHSHPPYKIASKLIQGFNPENRTRLTIPVRQTNPLARRGHALLIGFDTTKASDKWVRAALLEELGQEAWYCDSLEAEQCSTQSVTESAPDLIFISASVSNEQALPILLTLSRTFLEESDQQSDREPALIDVPGIFVVNESASSGRCLDRVAIEIKLG